MKHKRSARGQFPIYVDPPPPILWAKYSLFVKHTTICLQFFVITFKFFFHFSDNKKPYIHLYFPIPSHLFPSNISCNFLRTWSDGCCREQMGNLCWKFRQFGSLCGKIKISLERKLGFLCKKIWWFGREGIPRTTANLSASWVKEKRNIREQIRKWRLGKKMLKVKVDNED